MHNTEQDELTTHEQSHPSRSGAPTRGHVLPASKTHRRTGSAPDPWSPGYQRNIHRFSQPPPPTGKGQKRVSIVEPEHSRSTPPSAPTPEAHGHGAKARSAPLYAHHRRASGSSSLAVRVRKKKPSLANFFRKLNGERVRERGHKVPGVWESLKAIVMSSCELPLYRLATRRVQLTRMNRVEYSLCIRSALVDRCSGQVELHLYIYM